MMGFPAFHIALLQALLVAVMMLTIPMVGAFGGRIRMSGTDLLLLIPIYPAFAIVTFLVFWPFEANWGDTAFGPIGAWRGVIVGGAAVVLGTILTQRHQLSKLNANRVVGRLAAVFGVGAAWGLTWSLAGWLLKHWGMSNG
jgi:hypothetical protein